MAIWFNPGVQPADIAPLGKNTMGDHLGIVFTEIGEDFLKATMPVDHRTKQPYGLLHGGASAVLAETLGSVASSLLIDNSKYNCVGIEINANHLRGVREGLVTGIVRPLHTGKTTHVWDIKIYDAREKLICVSRLTVAIIKKEF
ncbi:hotdog fold thioesterase [Puia sp.]|jgi:1,4-dihydroxy-2-naphthoyl-CoA hydrolase|uniref:hotdog fold thioesterase n=1 Tax=Puia sp. TaxID=2045100 RepID=UPI002F414E4C